jgi:hypothetical protein
MPGVGAPGRPGAPGAPGAPRPAGRAPGRGMPVVPLPKGLLPGRGPPGRGAAGRCSAPVKGLLPGRGARGRGPAGLGPGAARGAGGVAASGAAGACGAAADGAACAAGASGSAAGGAAGRARAGVGVAGGVCAGGAAGDGGAAGGGLAAGGADAAGGAGVAAAGRRAGGAPAPLAGAAAGACAANASLSRLATGGSTVEDADLTYSPSSPSFVRTTLLSTPNSLASSWTRTFATCLLLSPGACRGPSAGVPAHCSVLIERSRGSRHVSFVAVRRRRGTAAGLLREVAADLGQVHRPVDPERAPEGPPPFRQVQAPQVTVQVRPATRKSPARVGDEHRRVPAT